MIKKILKVFTITLIFTFILCVGIVGYIRISTEKQIIKNIDDIDSNFKKVAVILGAAVQNGKPTPMLRDRLDAGIELYKKGKVSKLVMSGDGINQYYNEIRVMISYAIENGVAEEDIIGDNSGVNTSASIVNMKNMGYTDIILVSQKFHLNRALYLANKAGINALAYPAQDIQYSSLMFYYFRDSIAGIKDFIMENIGEYE